MKSLDVSGESKPLRSLSDTALDNVTLRQGDFAATGGRIPASSTAVMLLDVVWPRSGGRPVPLLLKNEITFSVPDNAPGAGADRDDDH